MNHRRFSRAGRPKSVIDRIDREDRLSRRDEYYQEDEPDEPDEAERLATGLAAFDDGPDSP